VAKWKGQEFVGWWEKVAEKSEREGLTVERKVLIVVDGNTLH